MSHCLSARQLAAVLAGLRTLQAGLHQGELALNEDGRIEDILTDGGSLQPLTSFEIDVLCEMLNLTEPSVRRVLVTVSGGVADFICDDSVEVEIFDWDNFKGDPEVKGGVHPRFADLALQVGCPVDPQRTQVATDGTAADSVLLPGSWRQVEQTLLVQDWNDGAGFIEALFDADRVRLSAKLNVVLGGFMHACEQVGAVTVSARDRPAIENAIAELQRAMAARVAPAEEAAATSST